MKQAQVILVELTDQQRDEFIREDIADYAEQLATTQAMSSSKAAVRANAKFGPEIRREHAVAASNGHQRWAALASDGTTVGWLWVTPATNGMPSDSVFLYQITVKPAHRRQGYGRAMLTALEQVLAGNGIVEIRLNVSDTNVPARGLYASTGYGLVTQLVGKSQLRKRFAAEDQAPATHPF